MTPQRIRLFILVIDGVDTKSFATIPELQRYCREHKIKKYTVKEEIRTVGGDDDGY